MARRSWVVDPSRFATKIKSASSDPEDVNWKSNPTIICPNCQHTIDNSDVGQQWPGLPKGVKFDPSDPEIIEHLLAKVSRMDSKPHPYIDEFITTVDREDGICYTHPQNLPGVKKDGTASHFFHRAIKAYGTGTRKRRKIQGEDFGDLRWHKTGRTKPVVLDGVQKGCKKILVLYMSLARSGKSEKTNWVIHQYHLGTKEDEKDGEYVISKIFYQQQPLKPGDKSERDFVDGTMGTDAMTVKVNPITPESVTPEPRVEKRLPSLNSGYDSDPQQVGSEYVISKIFYQQHPLKPGDKSERDFVDGTMGTDAMTVKVNPNTPESVTPEPRIEKRLPSLDSGYDSDPHQQPLLEDNDELHQPEHGHSICSKEISGSSLTDQIAEDHVEEGTAWWEVESQDLLNSQQMVEALSLCDEFLRSQSPDRDENVNGASKSSPKQSLSDNAHYVEECENIVLDPANIETDTPPDFRLSQLEFGSQDSFIAWGGGNAVD